MQPHDRRREQLFRCALHAVVKDVLQPKLGYALIQVDVGGNLGEIFHVARYSWIRGRGLGSPQDDGSGSLPNDDEVISYVGPYEDVSYTYSSYS